MAAMLFFGCLMVAFGVSLATFGMLIARKAQLVIVTISSSFLWLLSLIISSLLWIMIPPLKDTYWFFVPVGVLVQELGRYIFFKFYSTAERNFAIISTNAVVFPMSDLMSSIASGVGFGAVESLLLYGSLLSYSLGPGTLFSENCPQMSTFVLSAWISFCFSLLHIFMMIIAFDAFRRRSVIKITSVIFIHLLASLVSVLNTTKNGCLTALPLEFGIVICTGVYMAFVIHQNGYRSKRR